MQVDVVVLFGSNDFELTVNDVGNGEVLEDSGVWVSEVVVLNLEGGSEGLRNNHISKYY